MSLESTEFQCFINRKSKFILQVIDCYIQFFNSDSTKKAVNPNSHGPTLSISKIKCDVNQKTISQRTQKLHFRKNVFFFIYFISKKSYLQHRGSKSIINLNFFSIFLCRRSKIFIKSLKLFFPFSIFFLSKRNIKNVRRIKWMFCLPNLQLITYSLRFIKYFFSVFCFIKKLSFILYFSCFILLFYLHAS